MSREDDPPDYNSLTRSKSHSALHPKAKVLPVIESNDVGKARLLRPQTATTPKRLGNHYPPSLSVRMLTDGSSSARAISSGSGYAASDGLENQLDEKLLATSTEGLNSLRRILKKIWGR